MGTKKKKGKKEEKVKKEPEIIIPDYTPTNLQSLPLSLKIKHMKDIFIIYSDEYQKGIDIKQSISKIIDKPPENIRLYMENKRLIEDYSSNHDQQITHGTVLFASFKIGEGINDWENFKDIINFEKNSNQNNK